MNNGQTKPAVSVAEMARMCGLSRSRFYQLIGTVFPHPVYDVATRRPLYNEEQQRVCLDVRRRNCGIDGRAILFYTRGTGAAPVRTPKRRKPSTGSNSRLTHVVQGLKDLGLDGVTELQVAPIVRELFPKWEGQGDQGEIIRAVFLRLKRQNSGDKLSE